MNPKHQHALQICRDALVGGLGVQSTGEKLLAALILNRADWLQAMEYTIADAIDRVGPEWIALIPDVAKTLREEGLLTSTPPTPKY